MAMIIGVRFRQAGKIYYFDPAGYETGIGEHVVVETTRGIECGRVVMAPREVEESEVVQPLRKVIRPADEEDRARVAENKLKAREAFRVCKQQIRKHNLNMKLIDAEYTFDNKKVLFYFTADGRVDFRELIKDLASVFKTRIELRQIGVRDETKLLGGIGICGRPLCCHSYLSDFAPVSIKMAKEQNLSLNPSKISGVCGRLMCCLKNEQDTYEYLNQNLPGTGDTVQTSEGLTGEVQQVNILRQTVRVLVERGDDIEVGEYGVDELTILERHKKGKPRKKYDPMKSARNSGRHRENREESQAEGRPENSRDRRPERHAANAEKPGRDSETEEAAGRSGQAFSGRRRPDRFRGKYAEKSSAAGSREEAAEKSGPESGADRAGQEGSGREAAGEGRGRSWRRDRRPQQELTEEQRARMAEARRERNRRKRERRKEKALERRTQEKEVQEPRGGQDPQ